MQKRQLRINGVATKVNRNLIATDENGVEYPYDCYKLVDGMYVLDTEKLAEVTNSTFNTDVYNQIEAKEKSLTRPMRELLSTGTSVEDKAYAQIKVDTIESEIKELRLTLKG